MTSCCLGFLFILTIFVLSKKKKKMEKVDAIMVETVNDRGSMMQRIFLNDISSYREFKDSAASYKQTMIVVSSGKQFICKLDCESLDGLEMINLIKL